MIHRQFCGAFWVTGLGVAAIACSSSGSGPSPDGGSSGGAGTTSTETGGSEHGGASSGNGGAAARDGGASNGGASGANGGATTSSGGLDDGGSGNGGTGGSSNGGAGGTAGDGGVSANGGASGSANGGSDAGTDHDAGKRGPLLGAYCGNSTTNLVAFEQWLGRPVDGILGYTGGASWDDFDGSVGYETNLWSPLDRRVLWSVPLIPTGATLEDAAAGMYNDHYTKAAQQLAAYRPQDGVQYVRTGWEFNGNWMAWTAQGKAQAFIGAFQQFVTTFRSVSKRFVFEWNVNVGDVGMNPEDAYPGDAYVDIIGMDFYWNLQYDPADPEQAWSGKETEKYGLDWHQQFASTHGKPTAYSEWGVMSDGAGPYIDHAKAWFASHDVVYDSYWNSNTDFSGELSGGQYPNAGAEFQKDFGR